MTKFLPILSFAVLLGACNTNPNAISDAQASAPVQQAAPDTTGMAQFYAWKAQNELAMMKPADEPVQYVQTASSNSTKKAVNHTPARKSSSAKRSSGSGSSGANTGSVDGSNGQGGSANSESSGTAQAPAKKGMSKAAKGAIIGGAGGAIAGAVINKKNRVAGAVIGGVIGAGGGYVIGRQMDKKDAQKTQETSKEPNLAGIFGSGIPKIPTGTSQYSLQ